MGRFRKGVTPNDLNIPVYTNWDDFVADEVTDDDGDDALNHKELRTLVPRDLLELHLKETG